MSVETTQTLLRLLDTERRFAASAWLACLYLWINDGETATRIAFDLMKGFINGQWEGMAPATDEEIVDAWLSAAQVCLVNANEQTLTIVVGTANAALERARRSGDVVRAARIGALELLARAETAEDVPSLAKQREDDFSEASRVGDGFALGMRALALGRWHVGVGGLTLARNSDSATVARQALQHLKAARGLFKNQGMDPWTLFTVVQETKAYADLNEDDLAQACIDEAEVGLDRFPVFTSYVLEAVGQIRTLYGDSQAVESFRAAVQAAEESGLFARRERLWRYVQPTD